MRRAILGVIFMSLFFSHYAFAFSMDDCVTRSMATPYNMSESQARAACAAKNANSGVANTGHRRTHVPTSSLDLDEKAFDSEMLRYLKGGDIKFSTCVEWCADSKKTPKCPAGYSILPNTMSDVIRGAYHGRYRIRAGLCKRD